MNHYNYIILTEKPKLSILNDKLPIEIIDHIATFLPTLYLCVHYNRLIIVNIDTQQIIHIKLPLNINDAIFSLCGSKILCKTSNSIEEIDIKTHQITQLINTNIIHMGNLQQVKNNVVNFELHIIHMDIYNNNIVITKNNNEIIVIKNNNIIFNKTFDHQILNCKFISEDELIIIYNNNIITYNITTNKNNIIYKYIYNIIYLTIYNNQLLVCFYNNLLYYNKIHTIKSHLGNVLFKIKGAEFSGNNKYILLFGFESELSIIKILDKSNLNEIAIINLNENCRNMWIVSSNDFVIISETFFIITIWCLKTFKLLNTIYKFK